MDYKGLSCGICDREFADGDDVVVCPECGTPMHRACYKELGSCPNAEKHDEGYVFDGFGKITNAARSKTAELKKKNADKSAGRRTDASDKHVCPICGTSNRPAANFCDNCGARIAGTIIPDISEDGTEDFADPKFFATYALGQKSDVSASSMYEEDITAGDVACYVAVNTPYYLRAFKQIKNGSVKFNFSAAVFSGVWFIYRKLYKFGALFLSVEALLYALKLYFTRNISLDVMNRLLETIGLSANSMTSLTMEQYRQLSVELQKMPFSDQIIMMMPSLILILQLAVMVVCGALANKLYYQKCISAIKEVKEEATDRELSRSEISQSLYVSGGVNSLLGAVFGVVYLFFLFL